MLFKKYLRSSSSSALDMETMKGEEVGQRANILERSREIRTRAEMRMILKIERRKRRRRKRMEAISEKKEERKVKKAPIQLPSLPSNRVGLCLLSRRTWSVSW